jgi:hypothetical protein
MKLTFYFSSLNRWKSIKISYNKQPKPGPSEKAMPMDENLRTKIKSNLIIPYFTFWCLSFCVDVYLFLSSLGDLSPSFSH